MKENLIILYLTWKSDKFFQALSAKRVIIQAIFKLNCYFVSKN